MLEKLKTMLFGHKLVTYSPPKSIRIITVNETQLIVSLVRMRHIRSKRPGVYHNGDWWLRVHPANNCGPKINYPGYWSSIQAASQYYSDYLAE